MKNFYVYAHINSSREIFYIGKGTGQRCYSKAGRNAYWERFSNKYEYSVIFLKTNLSEELAFKYEVYYIKKMKPKTNLTLGGFGGNTAAKYNKHQLEAKVKKCRKARKKWWEDAEDDVKNKIKKKRTEGVVNMWKNMSTKEKTIEQKRRNSLRKRKKIKCIDNKKIYKTVEDVIRDFNFSEKYANESIWKVARGAQKHYKGFKFKYVT